MKFVKQYLKYPKKFEEAEDATGYATTVGPLAIPGKLLIPLNGTDWGGLPGFVYAVHPDNGEILWESNMIPGPGEPGAETWPGDSREYGGAGPWITGSWDPELKMYYTGTANAYPWNPKTRGDGKYDNVSAVSVVAVNTDTGKVAWRYVVVPGDPWDYDTMSTPVIVKIDGKKVLVQPNKTGYVHYLDPKTGQFLRAVAFADKINWAKGYDVEGRPIDQIALPKEGADPVEVWPSLLGAVNMFPTSYSPKTGLVYLPAVNAGMKYAMRRSRPSAMSGISAPTRSLFGVTRSTLPWIPSRGKRFGGIKRANTAMRAACSVRRAMCSSTPVPVASFMPRTPPRVRSSTRSISASRPKLARSRLCSMASNTSCKPWVGCRALGMKGITCSMATWWSRLRGKSGLTLRSVSRW